MDNLTIVERYEQTVAILDLAGQIRLGGGNVHLRATLDRLIKEGKENILLNLAKVSHIDSSGIGELVAGYASLQKVNGQLKLIGLSAKVREIMGMVKLLTIFDTFENEKDAIESFQINAESEKVQQSSVVTGKLDKNAVGLSNDACNL